MKRHAMFLLAASLACASCATAQEAPTQAAKPAFDAGLAKKTGADANGMRQYVLVVLKTGPKRIEGEARKTMFAGHFANMERLSKAGKLALAGPFGKNDGGWRGLWIFAVTDIEEARKLAATDPVLIEGEMVAEYYPWYGSAATMLVPELHDKLTPPAK